MSCYPGPRFESLHGPWSSQSDLEPHTQIRKTNKRGKSPRPHFSSQNNHIQTISGQCLFPHLWRYSIHPTRQSMFIGLKRQNGNSGLNSVHSFLGGSEKCPVKSLSKAPKQRMAVPDRIKPLKAAFLPVWPAAAKPEIISELGNQRGKKWTRAVISRVFEVPNSHSVWAQNS